MSNPSVAGALAFCVALAGAASSSAQPPDLQSVPAAAVSPAAVSPAVVSPVVVTTRSVSAATAGPFPETTESALADQVSATTDMFTVEDELKDLPDLFIRERHIGDTQDPITTRTSGVGSSARSLVYEDGILVSALIGNNNTNASPRWNLVPPDDIARTDVMYGPFSAAFPGNSIGEVVQITTRMPQRLEASLTAQGGWQGFSQYGTDETLPTGRLGATVGDRIGRFAVRLGVSHLETEGQPLYDVTEPTPSSASAAGTPAAGAYPAVSRTGQPVQVLGAGGMEHQSEDVANLKLTYDLTPSIVAAYTLGVFRNLDRATVQSYLHDATGAPAYAGALNVVGRAFAVPASAFDPDLYRLEEDHLAQSASLASHTGGVLDWELTASDYAYLKDRQRNPTGALPGAFSGGAGTITSLDGSGWSTLDAKAWWRPQGADGAEQVSFGLHQDRFQLESPKYATGDWIDGGAGATAAFAKGKTATEALWAQDQIALAPTLTLTLGGRYERWDAYDGYNASAAPALDVKQPALGDQAFSPKAVLAYVPEPRWRFTASVGRAYRFPTVEELYQAVATGNQVSVPDPDLKPEDALSEELSAERTWAFDPGRAARVRLSLFEEHVSNALISQSAPLVPGSSTLYSYVQNVGRTRVRGAELVADERGLGLKALELSGWITYSDSEIQADNGDARAVGKQLPQLPRLRAAAVQTWRPTSKAAFTVTERYSGRAYGTIDNSDPVADTFTGFSAFFVVDLHLQYRLTPKLTGDLGVDNATDRKYVLYHPFPQRSAAVSLRYAY